MEDSHISLASISPLPEPWELSARTPSVGVARQSDRGETPKGRPMTNGKAIRKISEASCHVRRGFGGETSFRSEIHRVVFVDRLSEHGADPADCQTEYENSKPQGNP